MSRCIYQTGRYTEDIRIWQKLAKVSEESSKGIIPSITPGRNKQTALLLLSIFDKTSVTASSCYFPHRPVMSGFIDIFYKWWAIANSKQ